MALVEGSYQVSPFSQASAFNAPESFYDVGTITQSGNSLLGNGATFTEDMVGGIITYGSTSGAPVPAMVTAFVSATELTVASDLELPNALPYVIWYGGFSADNHGNISYRNLVPGGLMTSGTADTYTAFAGGGQADATIITTQFANVSVVATAGDSIKLPADAPLNAAIRIVNNGAASMDVFPHVGGTINGGVVDAAVAQAVGAAATYVYYGSGAWIKM